MFWLKWLGGKLWAVLVAIGAALLLAAAHFKRSRDNWRRKAKRADAELEFRDDVVEADTEIGNEFSDRRARAEADKAAGKVPDNLREPDEW